MKYLVSAFLFLAQSLWLHLDSLFSFAFDDCHESIQPVTKLMLTSILQLRQSIIYINPKTKTYLMAGNLRLGNFFVPAA